MAGKYEENNLELFNLFLPNVKKLKQKKNLKGLIKALHHKVRDVRCDAAEALGQIGGPEAADALIGALDDENSHVGLKVVKALAGFKDPGTIQRLIVASKHSNSDVRQRAVSVLGQMGAPIAVEPLISALKDGKWSIRSGAAQALGEIGDARAVEPLISNIMDRGGLACGTAAQALGQIGDARAVIPLIAALKDRVCEARYVIKALGEIGSSDAVAPLLAELENQDKHVRFEVVGALGRIKHLDAVKPLIKLVMTLEEGYTFDGSEIMRKAAISALEKIGPPADASDSVWYLLATRGPDSVLAFGAAAVDPLIAALNEFGGPGQALAAEALGKIGDHRAVNPLILQLDPKKKDNLTEVLRGDRSPRLASAEALGRIGDKKAVAALIMALEDQSKPLREIAAVVLGDIGDQRAVEPLLKVLQGLRKPYFMTSGHFTARGEHIPGAIPREHDPDRSVREAVTGALAKLGYVMQDILQKKPRV